MFKRLLPMVMLVLSASQAWATTAYYIGASKEAAYGTDLGLAGLTDGSWIDFSTASPGSTVTIAGVSFTGPNDGAIVGSTLQEPGVPLLGQVQATIGGSVFAFATHLSLATSSGTWCLGTCDIPDNQIVLNSTPLFFAVIDTNGVSAVTLTSFFNSTLVISDFKLGTKTIEVLDPPPTSDTPEPASMGMLGGALAALGFMAQRRKRRAGLLPASVR